MKKLKVGDRMVVLASRKSSPSSIVLGTVQDPDRDSSHRVIVQSPHQPIDADSLLVIEKTDYKFSSFSVWKIIDEETTS